ncbi:MAG: hypothetical protein M3137_09205 [Actinomycetota bacterium]|nr:hypothetical protein [Actinomycetota bacterium]
MSRARVAVATVAALVAATVGTGCSRPSVPTMSNGSVSACYRAIPTASGALHAPKAKLLGVHRIPADKVSARLPPADRATADQDTTVCAVAWKGTFADGQVDRAQSGTSGSYAIVLVTSAHLKVLTSYVLDSIPKRLQGRFV